MSTYGMTQAPTVVADPKAAEERQKLEAGARNGAGWFFWIAGLSVINSVVAAFGSTWSFIFGLGISSVLGYLAKDMGVAGKVVLLGISLFIAGLFVVFGVLAQKRLKWGFVIGMLVYALDGLLSLAVGDVMGVVVHVVALVLLFGGLAATHKLAQMENAVPGLTPVKLD